MRPTRLLPIALALALLPCVLGGCGVGPSGPSDSGRAPTGVARGATLYFLGRDGRLRPQLRRTGHLGTIADALGLLLDGPGDSALRTGIRQTGVDRVIVSSGEKVIALRLPLAADEVSRAGIDQIVCTALGVYAQGGGSRDARAKLIFTLPAPGTRRLRRCPLFDRAP